MRNILRYSVRTFVQSNPLSFMVHRGEIVEKVIRKSGYPLTKLAEKVGVSRRTIYNKLEEVQLDYEFILKVGQIIHHDFTAEFPNMFNPAGDEGTNYPTPDTDKIIEDPLAYRPITLKDCERELISLQRRYITLMESHMELLKHKNLDN